MSLAPPPATAPAPTSSAPTTWRTVAELLAQLGDIPPARVLLQPFPGTATEQDVIALEARENRLAELVDGVLVEKAMGYFEGRLAHLLGFYLETYLQDHDLGIAAGADGMVRLEFGRVRIPDLSFVSWDRLPGRKVPREPIPDLVPDLAVEVLSESNTGAEMARKTREYFQAGVRLVWHVHPPSRSVRVFLGPDDSRVIEADGVLDGGAVLEGFTLPLAELFGPV